MAISFSLRATDPNSRARLGELTTPHGSVTTPIFMAVGTRATVKGLTPAQIAETGIEMVLGNTYHLALRPGCELIERMGGLHRFMGWSGPILTDSGGFQVFSLQSLRQVTDDGVKFRSHLDGSWLELSPESATKIQESLGADIAMCFDECPPSTADKSVIAAAVSRTSAWAKRCLDAHRKPDQGMFAIVQGGLHEDLRAQSAEQLTQLPFPGFAVGGLSVGEPPPEMYRILDSTVPLLPADKPRYLMGVGTPEDLLEAIGRGIDMFDCVMPTRNGRNSFAFTRTGPLRLRNAIHAEDQRPLDETCRCYACQHFSRGYIRHLFQVDEMLGPILLSIHNLAFYATLIKECRHAIVNGTFLAYQQTTLASLRSNSA